MKKSLLLLAGLLMVSSLASARVVGTSAADPNFQINGNDEVLTFRVNANVKVPLAAWWKDKGFFGSRTLVENLGSITMGQALPAIPIKEIYVMAPYKSTNNVKATLSIDTLVLTNGTDNLSIDMELRDKNGSSNYGSSIKIDADSAGDDGLAVIAAQTATNLNLTPYVGGEIVEFFVDTTDLKAPVKPGSYTGSAVITVGFNN